MGRKLFYFLFVLFLTFFSLPQIFLNQKVFAVTAHNCLGNNVDFTATGDPNPVQAGTKTITVNVDTHKNIPSGQYVIKIYEEKDRTNRGVVGKNYSVTINKQGEGRVENATVPDGEFSKGIFYIGLYAKDRAGGNQAAICTASPFYVVDSQEQSCRVDITTDLKPDSGIGFKVTGFTGDMGTTRGVTVKNLGTGIEFKNTCASQQQLTSGYTVTSQYGNLIGAGKYEIKITENCTVFNTSNGSPICGTPDTVTVDPEGGAIEQGPCTLSKDCPADSAACVSKQCPSKAKYCLPDPNNPQPNKGACTSIPPPKNTCEGNACETAVGRIGTTASTFATSILVLVLSLSGGILLIFLIINGYRLMASQGDPEKIKEARESIISAIAGLLFIIFSVALLQLITVNILGLPGFR